MPFFHCLFLFYVCTWCCVGPVRIPSVLFVFVETLPSTSFVYSQFVRVSKISFQFSNSCSASKYEFLRSYSEKTWNFIVLILSLKDLDPQLGLLFHLLSMTFRWSFFEQWRYLCIFCAQCHVYRIRCGRFKKEMFARASIGNIIIFEGTVFSTFLRKIDGLMHNTFMFNTTSMSRYLMAKVIIKSRLICED